MKISSLFPAPKTIGGKIYLGVLGVLVSYLMILFMAVQAKPVFDAMLTRPIETLRAMKGRSEYEEQDFVPTFFYPARDDKKGLVTYKKGKALDGYTVFTDTRGQGAALIDMDGKVVHSWQKKFSEIWPDLTLPHMPPEKKQYWGRVFLQPNGDIYVLHLIDGPPEKPFGVTKLDKDSNVIWKSPYNAHHDIALMPDGTIYTYSATAVYQQNPYIPFVRAPYIEESLLHLDAKGEIIEQTPLIEMLYNSKAKPLLDLMHRYPRDPKLNPGDLLHPNTITPIPAGLEDKAPMLKEGHLLLSFRNISLLAIVDPAAKQVTWASYGPWQGQHSPILLDDGTVLMFDNEGNVDDESGPSRALQIDLNTMAVVWEYDGTAEDILYSPYNGFVQGLKNGNVLITESNAGRIIEVTRDHEIVWEYVLPDRLNADEITRIATVFSGHRFTPDELPFLQDE